MPQVTAFGNATFTHEGACKVKQVTFYNGNAAVQGVVLSAYDLATSTAPLKLHGPATLTSQFSFDGFPFPSGFRVTPSDVLVTNIVVEFETDDV